MFFLTIFCYFFFSVLEAQGTSGYLFIVLGGGGRGGAVSHLVVVDWPGFFFFFFLEGQLSGLKKELGQGTGARKQRRRSWCNEKDVYVAGWGIRNRQLSLYILIAGGTECVYRKEVDT